ncbi:kinesin light chain [Pyrenophora tritici-repentis]|uniref:Kinesin light chain n=1 Tax=Pyrenophora tritici-repentis TaxID=45151 RepID=A0A922NMS3_9PLEO|nr:kinesin light chain [Pyrenophora tritici-repentis]
MRLLHYDALGRLVLTDFRGKTIPPYAILSHRWSDAEILIEDILNGTYKEKEEGYRKLRFCANQAAQDNLQYFWIDTCCIDRWNNNERSKAINSMFQWYKNAAQCYVFLLDVSVSTEAEPVQRSDWEALFRASAWFTRGWTLQELIAPASVDFFSREGYPIGDKASLDQLIHEITNIPLAALRNCPLHEFSTSERERWAESRRTTEGEDVVYCLLGILGVSMPTTYGEGQESARRRLRAELEGAVDAPSIIPFSRNPRFVGRESQLAELEAKLFSNDQTTTTLAIVGPGGTGKSQLALEVAHRTRQNNKNCLVFWMDASDKDSLYQSYASVAQKISVLGWDDDQADMKQLLKRCLVEISARKCLMIFDNTEHTTLRSSGSCTTEASDLADCLPQSKLCSVIFTTTNSATAQALALQNIITLRKLTLDAALRMLQVRLAKTLANIEQLEAEHLLRELSYLPLAVMQAAAYIEASGITVQEYRSRLDDYKEPAIEHSGDSSEGRIQESGVEGPVAAALFLSIDQISRDHAFAADCLFLAACVDRKDISLDLLEAVSMQAREDAIRMLDKYALVTRRPAESALDLHRLVHQALRKRLQMQGQLQEWTQRTITQLLQVFPDDDHSNRSKWRRLLPHAQYALSHSSADNNDEERTRLASKCATALFSDGRYEEAEELYVQVMQTRKRVLGDEHPDMLSSMNNLAATYWNQGRWKEAEELQVQVMQTRKRVLTDEHPDTLTSMNNLALTYWNQGRWKEAEELQVQVMQTRKRVLTDEHPDTLTSMNNLALTYWNQGRWKEAEELQVQVMQTRKRVLTDEHPDTLTSMNNLALTYWNQGRWKEAEELQVQVLQTRKRVLTDEHPDTLTSMANLASTYRNQGRWKEAEELEMQVLQTSKRVLSDEHPNTLTSMANLAATYRNQGRWKEAEELEVQVLQTSKRVLTDEHPDMLSSMNNLALTYWNQGRWKEAEELQVQVMQTRKRVLTDEHPDTLTSMNNLALTYWNQGRWKEAEELQVQVLQTSKRVLTDEHPDMLSSMNNLALTYWNQGRWKEAEELQVQVMQTRKRVLTDEHPDTLTSMNNLALTYRNQGRWKEAEELQVQVMQTRKRVLTDEHPNTLTSMANLAATYRNQGRWKEAEELQVQVLQTSKRVLSDEHPDTLNSMHNLAFTLQSQARHEEAFALIERCLQLREQVLGEEHPNTQLSLSILSSWRVECE